jgi:hypothetical protein
MLKSLRSMPESFRPVYEMLVANERYPYSFERFLADLPRVIPEQYPETAKLLRQTLTKMDLDCVRQASVQLAILCLARNKRSICMWSHYADHHKGMAIGLDFGFKSPGLIVQHGPVRYRSARVSVDPLAQPPSAKWQKEITRIVFTKSKDWKYEQEYRYVVRLKDLTYDRENKSRFLHIDSEVIREVIFGCWAPQSDLDEVRSLIKKRPRTFGHVQLYRCERHASNFQIKIVPI